MYVHHHLVLQGLAASQVARLAADGAQRSTHDVPRAPRRWIPRRAPRRAASNPTGCPSLA